MTTTTRGQALTEVSTLAVSSTGGGKSVGEAVDLVRIADEKQYAIVALDPHGSLAEKVVGHWSKNHLPRTEFERLVSTDGKVLGQDFLPGLSEPHIEREELAQVLMVGQGLGTLSKSPFKQDQLYPAIELIQTQPTRVPLINILRAFEPYSDEYPGLIDRTTSRAVRDHFLELERIRKKNIVQYDILTGPARRMVKPPLTSPVFMDRDMGKFDWYGRLKEKALIAIDGNGAGEATGNYFSAIALIVINCVRRYFKETGKPLRVVLVLEEAGALGLVTPFVQKALQECRKMGLAIHVILQSPFDLSPELFESVRSNCPLQRYYLQMSPDAAEKCAKALSTATYRSDIEHYTKEIPYVAGYEVVKTKSTTKGDHGSSTTESESCRPIPASRTEIVYQTPQLHHQLGATKLSNLNPQQGERITRFFGRVMEERVRMLEEPHPAGLTAIRLPKAIAAWLLDPGLTTTERVKRSLAARFDGMIEARKLAQSAADNASVIEQDRQIQKVDDEAFGLGYPRLVNSKGEGDYPLTYSKYIYTLWT